MGAYHVKGEYKSIIHLADSIMNDVEKIQKSEIKIKFYFNLATAHFNEANYNDALELIAQMKKMKVRKCEPQILNLEANVEVNLKNYENARKIYFKIIRSVTDINLVANCYSNVAWIYYKIKQYKNAKKYIDKAYSFFNQVATQYKFNILDNKFDIDIKLGNLNSIKRDFEELLIVFEHFDNQNAKDAIFQKMIDCFWDDKNETFSIVAMIKSYNYNINSDLLLKVVVKYCNDTDMIKLIS
jgi:tetratricopeptide (TPR) repeat protein